MTLGEPHVAAGTRYSTGANPTTHDEIWEGDERDIRTRYSQALLRWDLTGSPSLEEYAAWLAYDSNLPYRLGPGHLENLVDEALDRLGIQ